MVIWKERSRNLFYMITLLIMLLSQGCEIPIYDENANQFLSSTDTLIIRTAKAKGSGLFRLAAGFITFEDTVGLFDRTMTYPSDIIDIKGCHNTTDFREKTPDFIDIITGRRDTMQIFIVDQNNNQDFTDDSVRTFQEMDWLSSRNSIKCYYRISNGQDLVPDSSWLKIGTINDRVAYGRDEHLTAEFNVDRNNYKIGIIDHVFSSVFTYGADPEIAILAQNEHFKDTLLRQDLIKSKEYLYLDDSYYRFDSITNDGKYVTLVKEMDFGNKVGTQVGMIAPDFDCVSVSGDTIRSSNLRDRPIALVNSCGCGGDMKSTQEFFNMKNTFGTKIYALRLDSHIKEGSERWHINMEDPYNKDIYDKYRQVYCSRIGYLVGTNQKILDRFDIFSWKASLPNHIYD